jgi:hypothetical protein
MSLSTASALTAARPASLMDLVKIRDAACRWAFKRTYGRKPAPDELRDYQLALAERDRLGLPDARPIYARLRSEAGAAPAKAPRRRRVLEGGSDRLSQNGHVDSAPACIEDQPPSPKRRGGMPKGSAERARAFLHDQLVEGPKPGAEIEAAAQEAAIPERSLLAATDALGVRTQCGQWWLPG